MTNLSTTAQTNPTALVNSPASLRQGGLMGAMQKGPTDLWAKDYANYGDPKEQMARALAQQSFVRNKVFDPQYKKALDYALNDNAPEIAAGRSAQLAQKSNILTKEMFARNQSRSGSATGADVMRENDRLTELNSAKNVADASNMGREGTQQNQLDTFGDLTGMGVNVGRQALGLSAGAASAYQTRMNQNEQAQMAQRAQEQQQMIMGISLAVSLATAIA